MGWFTLNKEERIRFEKANGISYEQHQRELWSDPGYWASAALIVILAVGIPAIIIAIIIENFFQ